MERSTRSKRNYYYDHQQDFDNETTMTRTRPRFTNNNSSNQQHYFPNNNNRYRSNTGSNFGGGSNSNNNRQSKTHQQDNNSNLMVTTSYRILCHDMKAGGVIGKSGNIIKSIRQHTGAWINVHELIPGDEERIIEISDTRRRDPEGRMPAFSPAQEALFLIHDRILESDGQFGMNGGGGYGNEDDDYGGGRGISNSGRVATRLVVSRMHVGCLLGKGGKIIEQMRIETKTQIRILPRDHTLPRCVSMSEEIVQVVGEVNAVKNAIAIISSRLRESQHRDRSHGNFHGRIHSPEQFFPDDDYIPPLNNTKRRSSIDGPSFGSRLSGPNYWSSNNSSWQSGYTVEAGSTMADSAQAFHGDDLVFRILCPADRVNKVVGESDGILDLLQNDIGVDVKVSDPVSGSDEQIIIISSEEGPDDELFPAQEALLHIQSRIVDLVPDKDNIIKTKLIISANEIGCLKAGDGSLSEIERLTGAKLQILSRDKLPACISGTDELVQIEGEIKAARDALVELTSRLRSYLYKEFFQKDTPPPVSASSGGGNAFGTEAASPNNITSARDGHSIGEPPAASYHSAQSAVPGQTSKDEGASSAEKVKQNESEPRKDVSSAAPRISVPLVTRSILELVIPDHAVPKLVTKSKNRLAQISELSGANVTLVEDRPEVTEKIIQISGTPEQVERAQSLLQGFILSTQEDGP